MELFTIESLNFKPTNRSQRDRLRKLKRAVENTGSCLCHLCGKPIRLENLTLDHVHPKSQGGPDSSNNLKLAHDYCNQARSNMELTYYRMFDFATRKFFGNGYPPRQEIKNKIYTFLSKRK
jgi:5-methylcytosine-specific restriction endonuclease McrA